MACKHNIYIYFIGKRERQRRRDEREVEEKRETTFFILFDCVVYIILLGCR